MKTPEAGGGTPEAGGGGEAAPLAENTRRRKIINEVMKTV
ncbi:MAG: hypothetical protein KatS3mg035_1089 [Bacteroidia bacterium]|nr:MAG: hypothetical protein KatS3mg035_1089 [Bacteroidia bacterium]